MEKIEGIPINNKYILLKNNINLKFLADKSSKLRLCIDLFVATTGSNSLSQTSCETIVGIDKIKFNLHMCVEFSSVRPIFAKNRSRMGKSFCSA